jgi:hypothetical protein
MSAMIRRTIKLALLCGAYVFLPEVPAMAESSFAVKTVPVKEDGPENKNIYAIYRTYVQNRLATTDSWSEQALAKRKIEYVVHEIHPSLLPGLTAYRGEAVDRQGAEVDIPPTTFDQTAFVLEGNKALFLNFFDRQTLQDGEEFTDIPFCTPEYIHAVSRSVNLRTPANDREKAQAEAEKLRATACRSLLPQARSLFNFPAAADDSNLKRMRDLSAFLTFLLSAHHPDHRYATAPDTTITWAEKETPLPGEGWRFSRGSLPPTIAQVRDGGLVLSGDAVINAMSLGSIELEIAPERFRFARRRKGQIPYGP